MIRYLKRTYIFQSINKSPIMASTRTHNILQKRTVDLQRRDDSLQLHKDSLQRDKADIDKVIEENNGIYDKIKENRSLDSYYSYNYTIKMLQKENQELQRENEMLNEERNDLINKNNELKEFLKERIH